MQTTNWKCHNQKLSAKCYNKKWKIGTVKDAPLPKAKQRINKDENFIRNKRNNAKLICNISTMWQ